MKKKLCRVPVQFKFDPELKLNRAMMVQTLWNLAGRPAVGSAGFHDIAADSWYADAVAWAAENEIVRGIGDHLFAPTQEITREQMAVMLYQYCRHNNIALPEVKVGSFQDVEDISAWALDAVTVLYRAGIINGQEEGSFAPKKNATRAEFAQMLMGFMETIK